MGRRLTSGAAASGVGSARSPSACPASEEAAAHQPPAAEGTTNAQAGSGEAGSTARGDAAGRSRSAPSSRGLLPPPLAGESPPGPLLPPPMQPGMNAQRRLAYPEVKHPSASSIRIGAGPGSEHRGKKIKEESASLSGGYIGPRLPAAAKRAEPSRRLHRPAWIGQITNRKAGRVFIGWRGF